MGLLKTRFADFSGGLNKDTPVNLIRDNELQENNNTVHRSNIWTKRDGFTTPYTAIADGFSVTEVVDYLDRGASATTLLAANKDGIYYLSGTSWTQRLNLTTTREDTDKWFFTEVAGTSVVVNGHEPPKASLDPTASNYTDITWSTSTINSIVGTAISRANVVLMLNNRLVFFNVTDGVDGNSPFRVRWTNANNFTWSGGTSNFLDLDDSHSPIVSAGVLLNNMIAVFKEDLVTIIQNTGNPVFSIRTRFKPGILGPKAWTYVPNGGIFYVSNEGFHMFSGGLPEEIGRNKIRKYFFSQLDYQYRANVYCWTNWEQAEVVIHYPTGAGIPDRALVYNWSTGVWSTWDYEAYCGFYRFRQQDSTSIYYGGASGDVKLAGGSTDDGAAISATLTTKAFSILPVTDGRGQPITSPPNYIQINKVYTDARPAGTTISVGQSDYARETPTYTSDTVTEVDGTQPVVDIEPTDTAYVTLRATGFDTVSEMITEWTGAGDE